MKYYYIYKITNKINGKIYIGKRTARMEPKRDKYWGSGKRIKWAIEKYGIENFEKEILEVCNKDNLSEREIYYIELYNCRNNEIGYNIIEGGYGVGDLCHDMKTYYNPETDQEIRIKETENPPEGFIHGRRPFLEDSKIRMARPGQLNGMYGVHRFKQENPFWGVTFIINKKTMERRPWHKAVPLPKGFDYCESYYNGINKRQRKLEKLRNMLYNVTDIKIKKELQDEITQIEKDLYEFTTGRIYETKEVPNKQFLHKYKITPKRFSKELKSLWSEQRKEFWKTKEIETCPYCGKQGRGAGFYRWHMENCREHPTKGEANKQMQKDLHKKLGEHLKGRKGTTQDKICINNGIKNKFIYKEDLDKYPGYKIGMIKKK